MPRNDDMLNGFSDSPDGSLNKKTDPGEEKYIQPEIKTHSPRLHLLDAYRGLVVLMMTAYHFCFDLFVLYGGDRTWSSKKPVFAWEQFICSSFILLSGFVWNYGKKHCIKRGLLISACGLIVTIVTVIANPGFPIYYGVLFFIGAATILLLPISPALEKVPASVVLTVSLILFLLTYGFRLGYLGIYTKKLVSLPETLYRYDFLTPLGFPKKGFISGDYFPLIPWFFLYICGHSLYHLIAKKESFIRIASVKLPVLDFIGRHSLIIYMLHQPLCLLLLMVIMRFVSA
ncbi:MAG: DUF1624 domain-containing protein [Lachnospiraceae bacterium]|nr:DUF1624 domain-containing protein [Lachnospiraceae bacterium]